MRVCQSGSWKKSAQPSLYRYTFTSSTSWTVPSNVKSAYVSIAGGGAGGVTWNSTQMIGGASGGFLMSYPVNLTPGEIIPITVGAGGAVRPSHMPGVATGGGTTTFGSYLSCSGGGLLSSGWNQSWADPGNCGTAGGIGNNGLYVANSAGGITGGQTPLVYGNGGGAGRCDGCPDPNYANGSPGSPGVVILDVLY